MLFSERKGSTVSNTTRGIKAERTTGLVKLCTCFFTYKMRELQSISKISSSPKISWFCDFHKYRWVGELPMRNFCRDPYKGLWGGDREVVGKKRERTLTACLKNIQCVKERNKMIIRVTPVSSKDPCGIVDALRGVSVGWVNRRGSHFSGRWRKQDKPLVLIPVDDFSGACGPLSQEEIVDTGAGERTGEGWARRVPEDTCPKAWGKGKGMTGRKGGGVPATEKHVWWSVVFS